MQSRCAERDDHGVALPRLGTTAMPEHRLHTLHSRRALSQQFEVSHLLGRLLFPVCQQRQTATYCACGCGEEVRRLRWKGAEEDLVFVSHAHYGIYMREQFLSRTGRHRPLAESYLENFAAFHFRVLSAVRSAVCPFLRFLDERGIDNLQVVTPKTITEYLTWTTESGCSPVGKRISHINKFFMWARETGRRTAANPVIHMIHLPRKKKNLPRPFTTEQMNLIWELLPSRGSARLRFAAAIAEEADSVSGRSAGSGLPMWTWLRNASW
jgi:hypothetical protein